MGYINELQTLHLPPLNEIHWLHQNRPHYLQLHALSLRARALFPSVYPRHLLYLSDIHIMVIHLKNKMIQTKMFEDLHLSIHVIFAQEENEAKAKGVGVWRGMCGFIVKILSSKAGEIVIATGTQIKPYRCLFAG